jgi:hypothetical protein
VQSARGEKALIHLSQIEVYKRQAPGLKLCAEIALRRLGLRPQGETIWHPLGSIPLSSVPNGVLDAIVEEYLDQVR